MLRKQVSKFKPSIPQNVEIPSKQVTVEQTYTPPTSKGNTFTGFSSLLGKGLGSLAILGYLKSLFPSEQEEKSADRASENIKKYGHSYAYDPLYRKMIDEQTTIYQQGGSINQQGGTMNNQEELQKAFLQFLVQDAAAQGVQIQSEQDLQAYAQQLGEEGIKAKYQEFMQKMQGGTMAKLGAKLEYIKKLKGVCPEGYEMSYYKVGGRICKTCQKMHKMEAAQKGKKLNAVQQFKKDMKTKDEASRDSIAINKWQDQDVMTKKGNKGTFKKGVWTPDRKKYK